MKIIDIGCGQKKIDGAIGIDFSEYSVADIILDLNNEKLPFENNSIDYVYSSHALEHLTLEGFLNVISEIYRVVKENGQICITVPYFTTSLNFANPFHNNQICFNEHTFRFFSSDEKCSSMHSEDYYVPSCPQWGLRYSANEEHNIELKTIRVEYTYFDKYSNLTEELKREARNKYLNVVDSITYYLKPVKPAPKLIKKESKVDEYISIVKEKIEYFSEQQQYILGQEEYINHNSICNIEKKQDMEMYYEIQDVFVLDKRYNILKPGAMVISDLQSMIDKNQLMIDKYQTIINEFNVSE